ncbi:MAG TPA: hypothetical protein VFF30_10790 [Nitrososphaerales archaeon]|nr:hypothetical protein [Nitrososphaerales archaeon]
MTFEIELVRQIRAPKEFVFDWWTDLSPDDSMLVHPLNSRTVLSRSPTEILVRDDETIFFRRMQFDVRVTLNRPDSWVAEYDGRVARARSTYTLRSLDPSSNVETQLHYHTEIEPKGSLTGLVSPIAKLIVRRTFVSEFEAFTRALEQDYGKQKIKSL